MGTEPQSVRDMDILLGGFLGLSAEVNRRKRKEKKNTFKDQTKELFDCLLIESKY